MAIESVDLNRSGWSSSAERCGPGCRQEPHSGNVPPPVISAPRYRHLRRVRSPAMGIFLIGLWLGTFFGIIVAALLRAAAEHDLTG